MKNVDKYYREAARLVKLLKSAGQSSKDIKAELVRRGIYGQTDKQDHSSCDRRG